MPTISIGELRQTISDCLERVKDHRLRVVVTKHNNPIAAIVSLEDLLLLERVHKMTDYIIARAMWEEVKDQEMIPWEDVVARVNARKAAELQQQEEDQTPEVFEEQPVSREVAYAINQSSMNSFVRETSAGKNYTDKLPVKQSGSKRIRTSNS